MIQYLTLSLTEFWIWASPRINDSDITEDFVKRMNNSFEQSSRSVLARHVTTVHSRLRSPRDNKELRSSVTKQAIETHLRKQF